MARVKIEVDDEVVDAVFSEKDDFRLSVRGMTLMEAVLVEAIGDTFADGMPKALERLDWPSLVALAKALDLIDADLERALLALWNVRNISAHEISSGRGVLSEKGGPRLPLLPEARLPSRRRAGGLVAAGREVSEVLRKGAAPPGPVFGMTPQRVGSV